MVDGFIDFKDISALIFFFTCGVGQFNSTQAYFIE